MESFWKPCIKESKKSFDYMINNFNSMFDKDTIKHFYIKYVSNDTMYYADDISEQYGVDIHRELIPWIKNEFEKITLIQINNWKPFRDSYLYTNVYLGYKKLFQYKQYYFQLTIDNSIRDDTNDCKYCKNGDSLIHFELALYGWKDINNKLQPSNDIIPLDNLFSEKVWNKSPTII
jgi:hypothetical protein